MASVGETKKLIQGIESKLSGLSKGLDTSKAKFESAKTRADRVVAGSSTDVEHAVGGKMKKAAEEAATAKQEVEKAIQACAQYLQSKI